MGKQCGSFICLITHKILWEHKGGSDQFFLMVEERRALQEIHQMGKASKCGVRKHDILQINKLSKARLWSGCWKVWNGHR